MTTRVVLATAIGATVCAAVGLAATQAQAPRQPPVFRTNTELVEIDVVVIDKNGERVHGLTKDDFVLRDRREPQTIETFTEVRREVERLAEGPRLPSTIRVDVASNTSAQAGRLVVLVLDDLHVWQGRAETVKEIARTIVADLGPESSMALLQTGGDHSTEVTDDRTRLLAAIDRFKGRQSFRRPLQACDPAPVRRDDPDIFDTGCNIQNTNANLTLYESLKNAARILGRNDGRRKAFVLVSENLAKDPRGLFDGGTGTPQELSDSSGYLAGDPGGIAPVGPVSHHDYAILDMMNAMRAGNVATYAIDPRGEVTSQELAVECFPAPPPQPDRLTGRESDDPCVDPFTWKSWIRVAQNGLQTIAQETGGFAVINTDDFTSGINAIIGDLDTYYLLGFYTDDLTTKGTRPVRVEVRGRADLTLRYRRSYEVRPDEPSKAEAARNPLDVLVDSPLPSADLPLRLHAIPLPSSGNRSTVAVALELTLPRATLEDAESERLLDDIRYGVYAIDLKGARVREHFGSSAKIALRPRPGLAAPPNLVTYQIALEMELPAGEYQLRASAISEKLGAGGSVYLSLDVPDFSNVDLALTDLLLGYADGLRVPVARDQRLLTRLAVQRPTDRSIVNQSPRVTTTVATVPVRSPLRFEPTLNRTFARGDTLRLYVKAVQRRRASLRATVSALTVDDATVVTFDRNLPNDGTLDVRLPLAQLSPGTYRLRVMVSDGTHSASKDVGFVIRGPHE